MVLERRFKLSKVKHAKDKYYEWKREGNVLTMQKRIMQPSSCEEYFEDKEYRKHKIKMMKDLKKLGIDIVEFWVPEAVLQKVIDFYTAHDIKIEVVRKFGEGSILCRLSL